MITVHKWPVPIQDNFEHMLPEGAKILWVAVQNNDAYMWVLVDTSLDYNVKRTFRLAGTGHEIKEDPIFHRGSFTMYDGALIFHLFETVG